MPVQQHARLRRIVFPFGPDACFLSRFGPAGENAFRKWVTLMAHILILGGGLSGCSAALELAERGHSVTVLEKAGQIGGKVREFGCKASAQCNHCGVCLSAGLWDAVSHHDNIQIHTNSRLVDISGGLGDFTAMYDHPAGRAAIAGISAVIVAIGFEGGAEKSLGNLELDAGENVIRGLQLEKLLAGRTGARILPDEAPSVAFLQCFGSRDVKEKAYYCSRVCCGYATRAAKAIRHCHPKSAITIFYMDLQQVEPGQYYDDMAREGMEFIRCRPVRIRGGASATVTYEHPATGAVVTREFDLVVLSEGIHPPADAGRIAEICGLNVDERGFLRSVRAGEATGIYLAGCAGGPARIEEAYSGAIAVAGQLLEDLDRQAACCAGKGARA